MNLDDHTIEDMIVAAIKSEIDSRDIYTNLAERAENAFLKDKLRFLSDEEEKHREGITAIYDDYFPDRTLEIPELSPVPLPTVTITDERIPLSELLSQAMAAEEAAHEFYNGLAARIDRAPAQKMLRYFATMELGHYRLLEIEKKNLEAFEDFDAHWPMMHAGP